MQFNILPEGSKKFMVEIIGILRLKCWRPPSVIFTILKNIDLIFPEKESKDSKIFECFD
jgi:hypothetical protein